ncbi:TIGR04104 family putative zinc finger protein [Lentibacillus juripiscarius]|uniref:TIGR04104 family putative zinc finger protein n=1 Tax=Lentibacillus juripiscarius TaxID=257446 RepID=A0ABW5V6B5_9BACI
MPVCQHCSTEWTWKQTMKRMMKFGLRMKCPHCGEWQYESTASKKRSSMLGILPFPLIWILPMFNASTMTAIFVGGVLLVGMLSIYPFFMQLSNEEEPLW